MFVEILLRIGEKLSLKQKTYQLNHRYLIKVVELMTPRLRKPKHKSKFIVNDGEILPIILIDTMEGVTKHDN